MAAPDELFCWEGAWGLPSVDTDCLVVLVSVCPDWTEPSISSFVRLIRGPLGQLKHALLSFSISVCARAQRRLLVPLQLRFLWGAEPPTASRGR